MSSGDRMEPVPRNTPTIQKRMTEGTDEQA